MGFVFPTPAARSSVAAASAAKMSAAVMSAAMMSAAVIFAGAAHAHGFDHKSHNHKSHNQRDHDQASHEIRSRENGRRNDPAKDQSPARAEARYIANEGILIRAGETKILFDPLFHESYGNYLTPSLETYRAIMDGAPPYDGVDAIFISHAHGDHFSASDANAYLAKHGTVRLVAPQQAVDMMRAADGWDEALTARIIALDLAIGDPGRYINSVRTNAGEASLMVYAVRIPHAGWPGRADVQNMVYRVTLEGAATVMHMGDADPLDDHYAPYTDEWAARRTDTAFPPYWFFLSEAGVEILDKRLNVEDAVGVHVPKVAPNDLIETGRAFFSEPGEIRAIGGAEKD